MIQSDPIEKKQVLKSREFSPVLPCCLRASVAPSIHPRSPGRCRGVRRSPHPAAVAPRRLAPARSAARRSAPVKSASTQVGAGHLRGRQQGAPETAAGQTATGEPDGPPAMHSAGELGRGTVRSSPEKSAPHAALGPAAFDPAGMLGQAPVEHLRARLRQGGGDGPSRGRSSSPPSCRAGRRCGNRRRPGGRRPAARTLSSGPPRKLAARRSAPEKSVRVEDRGIEVGVLELGRAHPGGGQPFWRP